MICLLLELSRVRSPVNDDNDARIVCAATAVVRRADGLVVAETSDDAWPLTAGDSVRLWHLHDVRDL